VCSTSAGLGSARSHRHGAGLHVCWKRGDDGDVWSLSDADGDGHRRQYRCSSRPDQLLRRDGEVLYGHSSVGHGAVDQCWNGGVESSTGHRKSQLQSGLCWHKGQRGQHIDGRSTHGNRGIPDNLDHASGNPGDYTLTATVFGNGSASPTGTVSFLDTSNANQSLATAPLMPAAAGLNLLVADGGNLLFLPANFVVGDFNGDGIPDEAASNLNAGGGIEVWLGNGDGTFKGGIESPVTTSLFFAFVTVGDFNGDGKADLAVANYPDSGNGPYSETILLGNGDGTFVQAVDNPATGNQPLSMVAGDFNGDGNLDLAVANSGSNTLTILLGNGDGTFTAAASPRPEAAHPRS
jgi:FG-GAP-like repeat